MEFSIITNVDAPLPTGPTRFRIVNFRRRYAIYAHGMNVFGFRYTEWACRAQFIFLLMPAARDGQRYSLTATSYTAEYRN